MEHNHFTPQSLSARCAYYMLVGRSPKVQKSVVSVTFLMTLAILLVGSSICAYDLIAFQSVHCILLADEHKQKIFACKQKIMAP
eukprot:scaffold787_cov285-Chaetoceros_neogracile.AAC.60